MIDGVLRALRLVDPRLRRRYVALAGLGIIAAALDAIAILLLVPLLAFLGQPSPPVGITVRIIQRITGDESNENVVLILAAVAAVLFISKSVFSVGLLWLQTGVLNRAATSLAGRLLEGFARAPWIVQQSASTASIVRTSNTSVMAAIVYVGGAAFGIVADAAVFIAVFAALLWINPLLATAAVAYLGLAACAYYFLVRARVQQRGLDVQVQSEKMNRSLLELVGGIKELIVADSASTYVSRYTSAFAEYTSASRTISVTNFSTRYIFESLMVAGVSVVVLVAAIAGTLGSAVVAIGVLLAAGTRALPALSSLLIWFTVIRTNLPAVAIVDDELRRLGDIGPPGARGRVDPGPHDPLEVRELRLSDVTFAYPGAVRPALNRVSIGLSGGTSLGIVGGSGAGKSTLVDVLLGLLPPDSGEATVNGVPLQGQLARWRASIGYVPQEIFIVDDSITANVVFGRGGDTIDATALQRAVRLAHLDEVVSELPDGLETSVGERGARLSGGQRQRIGLARALYRNPSVLILDEATSALDNETEYRITQALHDLRGQMTMIVVAHRLSTIHECDQILYLEDGLVGGIGAFSELRTMSPGFARLVERGTLKGVI